MGRRGERERERERVCVCVGGDGTAVSGYPRMRRAEAEERLQFTGFVEEAHWMASAGGARRCANELRL